MKRFIFAALVSTSSAVYAEPPAENDLGRIVEELRAKLESQQATLDAQQQQIESQSAEINDLRKQVPGDWLTEQRADEVKKLVGEVLADADTRASLLQGGATAGYDKGFFVGSADGNFMLRVGGQVQPRYIANSRDDGATGSPDIDNEEFGFQIRRVKLWFHGHILNPSLTYRIQMAANRDTTGLELEEGWINYALNDDMKVFVGRFSDPILRDGFTSNSRQLAVERSITSYIFAANDNYAEGAGLDWRPGDAWRIRASINDGIGSGTPGGAGNDFFNDATDIAGTARVDWKIAGDWKQMDDYSAWSGESFGAFVGGAIHYEIAETGDGQTSGVMPTTGPYDDFIVYTIDGSIENAGLNLYGAFIGQTINATATNPIGDVDNHGFVVQGGYMIVPDKFEPFARYEFVSIDNGTDDLNLITGGFNYYWNGHATKFSADIVYAMDPLTALNTMGTSLTGAGLLPDNDDGDGQIALRAQFQLLF